MSGQQSALHVATRDGNVDNVQALISAGVNVNNRNKEGNTALHIAAAEGHFEIVELLLKSWADIKIRNEEGDTTLHLALKQRRDKIALFLLRLETYRAELIFTDANEDGETPFQLMLQRGFSSLAIAALDRCYTFETNSVGGMHACKFRIKPVMGQPEHPVHETPLGYVVANDALEVLAHPVMRKVIEEKWINFGWRLWLRKFLQYIMLVAAFLAAAMTMTTDGAEGKHVDGADDTTTKIIAYTSGILMMVLASRFFLYEYSEFRNETWRVYFRNPWNWVDVCVVILSEVIGCLLLTFWGTESMAITRNLTSVASIAIFSNTLQLLQVFRLMGTLTRMFMAMFTEIFHFMAIFGFFWIGFSLAFHLLLSDADEFSSVDASIITTMTMLVGNIDQSVMQQTSTWLDDFMLVGYVFVCSILLLNMIIAMMSSSYDRVHARAELEALMVHAGEVLRYESQLKTKDRSVILTVSADEIHGLESKRDKRVPIQERLGAVELSLDRIVAGVAAAHQGLERSFALETGLQKTVGKLSAEVVKLQDLVKKNGHSGKSDVPSDRSSPSTTSTRRRFSTSKIDGAKAPEDLETT